MDIKENEKTKTKENIKEKIKSKTPNEKNRLAHTNEKRKQSTALGVSLRVL